MRNVLTCTAMAIGLVIAWECAGAAGAGPATKPAAAPTTATRPAATPDASVRRVYTITAIAQLKMAIISFEIDNGRLPTNAEGLQALVVRPKDLADSWKQLIDKVPKDGWDHDFVYRSPSTLDPDHNDYDIVSPGPDGKLGTADDINQTTMK